jgi:hypothetical protein
MAFNGLYRGHRARRVFTDGNGWFSTDFIADSRIGTDFSTDSIADSQMGTDGFQRTLSRIHGWERMAFNGLYRGFTDRSEFLSPDSIADSQMGTDGFQRTLSRIHGWERISFNGLYRGFTDGNGWLSTDFIADIVPVGYSRMGTDGFQRTLSRIHGWERISFNGLYRGFTDGNGWLSTDSITDSRIGTDFSTDIVPVGYSRIGADFLGEGILSFLAGRGCYCVLRNGTRPDESFCGGG